MTFLSSSVTSLDLFGVALTFGSDSDCGVGSAQTPDEHEHLYTCSDSRCNRDDLAPSLMFALQSG